MKNHNYENKMYVNFKYGEWIYIHISFHLHIPEHHKLDEVRLYNKFSTRKKATVCLV